MSQTQTKKFCLGRIVATPGALKPFGCRSRPGEFLARHVTGDWGELDDEDRSLNDAALIDGSRILSAYQTVKGERLWVITEAQNEVGLRYCDDRPQARRVLSRVARHLV